MNWNNVSKNSKFSQIKYLWILFAGHALCRVHLRERKGLRDCTASTISTSAMDHYTSHCYFFYGFCFLFFLGVYSGTLLGHFIMIFYLPLVSPQRGNPTRTSVHGRSYTVKGLGFHTNYNKRPSLLTMSPQLPSYYFNNFFRTKITRRSQC